MSEPSADFLRDYQHFAQQSWEAWTRQLAPIAAGTANPFVPPQDGQSTSAGAEPLQQVMYGFKHYADWLQQAAAGAVPAAEGEPAAQRPTPAWPGFGGSATGATATDPLQAWRDWMAGFGDKLARPDWFPGFGLAREQQAQQQALLHASLDQAEAAKRYQALLSGIHAKAVERLQQILAEQAPAAQPRSVRALYDLWVEVAEQVHAEAALSGEFREAYAQLANAQMHLRRLQQQQVEQWCREWGMPTRSEVDSLGRRVQELRRQRRAADVAASGAGDGAELDMLRAEVAALRAALVAAGLQQAAPAKSQPTTRRAAAPRPAAAKPAATAAAKRAATKAAVEAVQPARRTAGKTPSTTTRAGKRKRS